MGKKNRNKGRNRKVDPAPIQDTKSPMPRGGGMPGWVKIVGPLVVIGIIIGIWIAMGGGGSGRTHTFSPVTSYPSSTDSAYTQGLEFYKGFLFESTGKEGESDWRIVNYKTGKILYRVGLESSCFGEGVTILDDKLYQVTWKNQKGFVYDLKPLGLDNLDPATATVKDFLRADGEQKVCPRRSFEYQGQGWGMTNDGTHLIMSTGSPDGVVYVRKQWVKGKGCELVRKVTVTEDGKPVGKLNELELVDGVLYANVFLEDDIKVIDFETGEVKYAIDMHGLLPEGTNVASDEVLNGIAHHPELGFFVTGKNWPLLFNVTFEKK